MGDVHLSEREQAALRFVLAAEPLPGQPLPAVMVLERLATLVRCDVIGASRSTCQVTQQRRKTSAAAAFPSKVWSRSAATRATSSRSITPRA